MSNADGLISSYSSNSLNDDELLSDEYSIESSSSLQFNDNNNKHPEKWNKKDVKQWLKWCSKEYALNDIPFDKFEMNGKALCMFTEDMFKQRVPNSGDLLYKALRNIIPYQEPMKQLNRDDNSLQILEETTNKNIKIQQQQQQTQYYLKIQDQESDSENSTFDYYGNKNDDNHQLIIDENSCHSLTNNNETTKKTINEQKTQVTTSLATTTTTTPKLKQSSSKKRGANLENVIGNLKTRKIMECVYSKIQFNNPMLSPSSSSTTSTSSNSSSSILATPKQQQQQQQQQQKQKQKQRWMIDTNLNNDSIITDNSSPNNTILSSPLSSDLSPSYDHITTTEKLQKTNKKTKGPTNKNNNSHNNNAEDPTRQIKFYDDYIDFRGDILKRPPGAKNCRILWEYLYTLLQDTNYATIIRWEDENQMIFRIIQAEKLAALWGLQKNRLGMTYEKLSRGMRYYYPNNIIAREPGRRLLYRFMRHPDEIKKSVKKNGTYMLKKGGTSSSGSGSVNASGNTSLNSKSPSHTNEDYDDMDDDSGLDESYPSNTQNKILHSTTLKKTKIQSAQQQQQQPKAQFSTQPFYPNLYPYLAAAAAAAAYKHQQQQHHSFLSSTNTTTSSTQQASEEESVAQFLMQLRNKNELNTKKEEDDDDDDDDEQLKIETTKQHLELPLNLCKKRFLQKLNESINVKNETPQEINLVKE